eukprot:13199245-Ditylum_brightwellii.AAC.1
MKANYSRDSDDKDSDDEEDYVLPKGIQKLLDEGKLNIDLWMSSEYCVLFGARDIEKSVGEAIGNMLDILESHAQYKCMYLTATLEFALKRHLHSAGVNWELHRKEAMGMLNMFQQDSHL